MTVQKHNLGTSAFAGTCFPGTCSLLFVCFTLFDLRNDGEGAYSPEHLLCGSHQLLVVVDGEHHAVLVQPVEVEGAALHPLVVIGWLLLIHL